MAMLLQCFATVHTTFSAVHLPCNFGKPLYLFLSFEVATVPGGTVTTIVIVGKCVKVTILLVCSICTFFFFFQS